MLNPWVKVTNILRAAFMCVDPKSTKINDNLTIISVVLGSACIKTAQKGVKLTPYMESQIYVSALISLTYGHLSNLNPDD